MDNVSAVLTRLTKGQSACGYIALLGFLRAKALVHFFGGPNRPRSIMKKEGKAHGTRATTHCQTTDV
jgi:hypothetical protein